MKIKKEKLLIILAFLGLVFSFLLLLVDMNAKSGISNAACNISSYINCDKVATSSYSHVFSIPVSLIGMFFYFFIAFYAIFSKNQETFFQIGFWIFALASLVSLFLLSVSIFQIKALCIFCSATYLVNFVSLYLLKSSYKLNFSQIFTSKNIAAMAISLLLAVALAIIAFFLFKPNAGLKNKETRDILSDYQASNTYTMNLMFAPYMGSNSPKIEVVVYSDFFCSHCRHFMGVLDNLMKDPKYMQSVRIYYKTYPLDNKKCTDKAKVKELSPSCRLSLLSFEMLKKGLFWEFETITRENPLLNADEGLKTAEELNRGKIDLNKVKENNAKYVQMNIREASALGIIATPTWFANGRKFEGAYEMTQLKTLFDHIIEGKN